MLNNSIVTEIRTNKNFTLYADRFELQVFSKSSYLLTYLHVKVVFIKIELMFKSSLGMKLILDQISKAVGMH